MGKKEVDLGRRVGETPPVVGPPDTGEVVPVLPGKLTETHGAEYGPGYTEVKWNCRNLTMTEVKCPLVWF